RHQQGGEARPLLHHQVITLPAFDGNEFRDGRVEMVYQDIHPASRTPVPTELLIHGNPARSYELQDMADTLGSRYRVIAPELPGFGRSTRDTPDYSFVAHAAYLNKLLESLSLSNVHVVAFSQGGGVALELYQIAPEKIASL